MVSTCTGSAAHLLGRREADGEERGAHPDGEREDEAQDGREPTGAGHLRLSLAQIRQVL